MRRVVVTGIGAVTPLGSCAKSTWDAIKDSRSGICKNDKFDCSKISSAVAALIKNYKPEIDPKSLKRMDLFIQYAISASDEAIRDSGIIFGDIEKNTTGVLIGSGIGGMDCIENNTIAAHNNGLNRVSPFFIPASIINLAPGNVAIRHGLRGPNISIATACATGTHSIGEAARMIQCGDVDIMLAGATEAPITPASVAGFSNMKALSSRYNTEPHKASRPWDKGRDGFVISEGAGVLVLEEYERAKNRSAKIYGEIIGYGLSCDANHITAPCEDGAQSIRAMDMAISKAKISYGDIDYVNAHGTSTPLGDMIEYRAMEKLFYDQNKNFTASSTKSSLGHMLGAAGAVEAILCLLAMQDSVVPPTINLDEPEDCIKIDLVPHYAKDKKLRYTMSNSFGFGGTNASLIFSKV